MISRRNAVSACGASMFAGAVGGLYWVGLIDAYLAVVAALVAGGLAVVATKEPSS